MLRFPLLSVPDWCTGRLDGEVGPCLVCDVSSPRQNPCGPVLAVAKDVLAAFTEGPLRQLASIVNHGGGIVHSGGSIQRVDTAQRPGRAMEQASARELTDT